MISGNVMNINILQRQATRLCLDFFIWKGRMME